MFSNLRVNSQVYILHKDSTPYIEVGTVTNVTLPVPKYPVTNFSTPQELVVDVTVKVKENSVILQKLPSNLDIADQGTSMVVTTSREAMNAEIDSLRQKSLNILNSIDYHKKMVQDCESLLQELNPEFAEKQQQKEEINLLKTQMSEMMNLIKQLKEK